MHVEFKNPKSTHSISTGFFTIWSTLLNQLAPQRKQRRCEFVLVRELYIPLLKKRPSVCCFESSAKASFCSSCQSHAIIAILLACKIEEMKGEGFPKHCIIVVRFTCKYTLEMKNKFSSVLALSLFDRSIYGETIQKRTTLIVPIVSNHDLRFLLDHPHR